MQNVYKRRKDSFDKETEELQEKRNEVNHIRKKIRELEQRFSESDEIIKLKKEQRDFYSKMIGMLEVNYNEYCKHVQELVDMYRSKYKELELYKQNFGNLNKIFFDAMNQNTRIEKDIEEEQMQIAELKQQCKILKDKL